MVVHFAGFLPDNPDPQLWHCRFPAEHNAAFQPHLPCGRVETRLLVRLLRQILPRLRIAALYPRLFQELQLPLCHLQLLS